jgi:hypothetical protein
VELRCQCFCHVHCCMGVSFGPLLKQSLRDLLLALDMQGFPQAFPIFQTYLSTGHASKFPGSVAIRLLAPGLQDIEEGILFQFLPKATRYRQLLVVVGISIIPVSLGLASFATADWHIVLLQGVLFGSGGILMNYVHVFHLSGVVR